VYDSVFKDRGEVHSAGASLVGVAVSMNWTLLLFFGSSSFFFRCRVDFFGPASKESFFSGYTSPVKGTV
jgi:hypothetical protein